VCSGFSAVIGSWNTMPIRRPRRRPIAASSRPSSSVPSKRTEPLARAASGSRPISASAVIDLPQPDSPISPAVSPRSSENDTPRSASAGPRGVGRVTRRSLTSSRAKADVDWGFRSRR
jgi:hypothetical protein